jgi:hypothetical protein
MTYFRVATCFKLIIIKKLTINKILLSFIFKENKKKLWNHKIAHKKKWVIV